MSALQDGRLTFLSPQYSFVRPQNLWRVVSSTAPSSNRKECTYPHFEQQTRRGQLPICDHSFPYPGSQYDFAPQLLTQTSLAQSRPKQSAVSPLVSRIRTSQWERTVRAKAAESKLGAALVPLAWIVCVAAELEIASALTPSTTVIFGSAAEAKFTTAARRAQLCFAAVFGLHCSGNEKGKEREGEQHPLPRN